MAVDGKRCAGLLDLAVTHDHHAVAQGHGLDLVVGHEHRGGRQLGMQPLDLDAHLGAQLGVEVAERLVEQEDQRIAHDAAAKRHALLLAAGKLSGAALQQVVQPQDLGSAVDRGLDLALGHLLVAQAESEIVVDAHVLIERVILKHHGDIAVARRQMVDHAIADADLTARDVLEAGDHAQGRRLAAARRADQRHELLVGDREVDVPHGVMERTVVLVELAENDGCHDSLRSACPLRTADLQVRSCS
jgi:hypothetical protein